MPKEKAHPKTLRIAKHLLNELRMVNDARPDHAGDLARHIDKWREDADETNMLALQLEQLSARVYEDEYIASKARQFLPVNNELSEGADVYSFERTGYAGEAKIITNFADDLPTVETSGNKETHSVVHLGMGYDYSILDMARAAFTGKPLSTKKATAARDIWERRLDDVASFGAPDHGIATGVLNDANIATEALAAAGAWSTKTAPQILADLNALVRSVFTGSEEIHQGGRLVLPSAQYLQVLQTQMSVDNGETIASAFMRANPMVSALDSWNKLAGAGAGDSDRAFVFKSSLDVLELAIAREFTLTPPVRKNLAFRVDAYGSTAGAIVNKPLACKYMDGI